MRGYVVMTPALGRDMAKLLIDTDAIESDLEDEVQSLDAAPQIVSSRRTLGVGGPQL